MIVVTADTNIYISALNFSGAPRRFLIEAIAGSVRLAVSAPILDEIEGVLRDKFSWSPEAIRDALTLLAGCATVVVPTESIDVVYDDPDDNRILECAVSAGSRFIVTGDAHLLRLGNFRDIRIVGVVNFLKLLERPASEM